MAEAPAETVVNVRRMCLVKPAIPTPTQTVFLSNLDLLWLPVNNVQNLLFYKLSPLVDYSSVIEGLKKSLSSVLVYFYPLAGRLKNGESGRMEADCNDGGVEFTEASINILFRDLEGDGFRRKPFFKKLVHKVDIFDNKNPRRPLLSIQVTAFEGGEMCIGTTFHHVIADGNSFWYFMKSWADCSRGLPIGKLPQIDRTVLKRGNKSSLSVSYKAHEIVSNGITGVKIFKFVRDDSEHLKIPVVGKVEKREMSLEKWTDLKNKTEVVYSTFCFTEEIIEDLKQRSGASSSSVAVAAQFWRCVIRAREVPLEEAVYFSLLVDCRARTKPLILPTYFGNCLCLGVAQTTANALTNANIFFAAEVIQQLIDSCSDESQIDHLISWAETSNINIGNLLRETGWQNGTNTVSSPKFPLYEIDYGWGKPSDVQVATINEIGAMVLSCAKDGGKSILVSTCLPQHQMDLLHHLLFVSVE